MVARSTLPTATSDIKEAPEYRAATRNIDDPLWLITLAGRGGLVILTWVVIGRALTISVLLLVPARMCDDRARESLTYR